MGHSENPFCYFQVKNNATEENLVASNCSKLSLETEPKSCTKEKESDTTVIALPTASHSLACSSGTFWAAAPLPFFSHIVLTEVGADLPDPAIAAVRLFLRQAGTLTSPSHLWRKKWSLWSLN